MPWAVALAPRPLTCFDGVRSTMTFMATDASLSTMVGSSPRVLQELIAQIREAQAMTGL